MICVQLCPTLASRDTFVPSKIVLKRDFERNHLAEKSNRTQMGQKIHCNRDLEGTFVGADVKLHSEFSSTWGRH
jgi:hypothetical protein